MILAINPGSTSTKIAVYEDKNEVFTETLRHSAEELDHYPSIIAQREFREDEIQKVLKKHDVDIKSIEAVVGRGGLLKPVKSGVYEVNQNMLTDLTECRYGAHASNLGGIIAHDISEKYGLPAYVADPPTVDEMLDIAKYTGIPEVKKVSVFHALNQKAVAYKYAESIGKTYKELSLVIAHMGGGVSVSAHDHGRVIDTTNASDGDGPFSTNRVGAIPFKQVVELCFCGAYSRTELMQRIISNGGMSAYLGSNDMIEIEQMKADGNADAAEVIDAYIYQMSKNISAMAGALSGNVDQIILTGGIAHDKYIVEKIKNMTSFIAPVSVYPGEDEMSALAQGVLRVINGEESVEEYI